ncbi:MAG TPA: DsbA family protein [Xanthobacteraceae bacterium]|nr:DsbA family protein [Xanthobacteraceae bacterium]
MTVRSFRMTAALAGIIVGASTFGWAEPPPDQIQAALAIAVATHPDVVERVIKDYMTAHPDAIGDLVKQYLATHPAALEELVKQQVVNDPAFLRSVIAELTKARPDDAPTANAPAPVADSRAAIKANAQLLFGSPHQVTLGDRDGKVTLVEFFDYNCGFCKRALADTVALLEGDPKLRIVLKEFPILGPGSTDAAKVAVAVRMQDPSGAKYLAFHRKLLGAAGPADSARALAAAQDAGVDVVRLKQDMESPDVAATLAENVALARTLGITGTPSYVIGDNIVPGAIGVAALRSQIDALRKTVN